MSASLDLVHAGIVTVPLYGELLCGSTKWEWGGSGLTTHGMYITNADEPGASFLSAKDMCGVLLFSAFATIMAT